MKLHGATEQERHDYSWAIRKAQEALEQSDILEALKQLEKAWAIEREVYHRNAKAP